MAEYDRFGDKLGKKRFTQYNMNLFLSIANLYLQPVTTYTIFYNMFNNNNSCEEHLGWAAMQQAG